MADRYPLRVFGRLLTCTRCGAHVDFIEIPERTPADAYVCDLHLQPVAAIANTERRENEVAAPQAPLAAPPRPLAHQIRQYVDTAFGSAA